jgi:hypothetical protein
MTELHQLSQSPLTDVQMQVYMVSSWAFMTLLFPQNKRACVSLLAIRRTQVAEMLQHQHGERAQDDAERSPHIRSTINCRTFFNFYQSVINNLFMRIPTKRRSRTMQSE